MHLALAKGIWPHTIGPTMSHTPCDCYMPEEPPPHQIILMLLVAIVAVGWIAINACIHNQ